MDFYFFELINNLAGKWRVLDWFGIFCADYLIFVMVFLVIVWTIFNKNDRRADEIIILEIILSGFFGYLVKIFINLFYFRPRPFSAHDVNLLIGKLADGSFPSAHAFLSFAMAFMIYFYSKKLGIVFLVLAALVSISRIYVGVHYPLDILGGILLGAFSALLIKKYLSNLKIFQKSL
jgi:undecaprenyl-diphosphatase